MKPTAEHIPFLDYFRGVAILSVFLFHSLGGSFVIDHLPWSGYFPGASPSKSIYLIFPAAFGFIGVPIFFALSGFCIHLSHQRSANKDYRIFFIRRFFRIYPPYLLALLFFAFAFYPTRLDFVSGSSGDWNHFATSTKDLLSHLFLAHNFSNTYFFGVGNPAFWSIAVEAQLYLLYPALLWLTDHLGWKKSLWIVGLIEIGLRGADGLLLLLYPMCHFSRWFTDSPLCFWFSWSIGAALADAYLKGASLPFRSAWSFLWPLLLCGFYFFKPLSPLVFTMAALSSTCAMAYYLSRPSPTLSLSSWRSHALEHLRWAGIVSYSAYLIHLPLLDASLDFINWAFSHPLHPLIQFVFCLFTWLPILGLSYLFYRYVECPSIALGKRVIKKIQKTTPAFAVPLKTMSV